MSIPNAVENNRPGGLYARQMPDLPPGVKQAGVIYGLGWAMCMVRWKIFGRLFPPPIADPENDPTFPRRNA